MDPEVTVRKANQRTPILSLIDEENSKSVANLPRNIWEPLSYLESEAAQAIERVTKRDNLPPELEWVRRATIKSRAQVMAWLKELRLESQSIDGLRSWQMMTGLQAQNPTRPSIAVMPDFPQPVPPGQEKPRRGMMKRGNDG